MRPHAVSSANISLSNQVYMTCTLCQTELLKEAEPNAAYSMTPKIWLMLLNDVLCVGKSLLLWQLCHVSYLMLVMSCQLCHVSYAMSVMPCQLCRVSYVMSVMPCQLCYVSYIMSVMSCQLCHVSYAMSVLSCQLCHVSYVISAWQGHYAKWSYSKKHNRSYWPQQYFI